MAIRNAIEKTQRRDQQRERFGLLGVIIGLPDDLHVELRIGRERILELLERARRIQPDGDGLERIAAIVGVLQYLGVGPDFRFRRAAVGRKNAHHRPFVTAHFDGGTDVQSGKFLGRAAPDDDFVLAPLEHPALDDFQIVAHQQRRGFHAAQRDVGVRAGGAFGQVNDDEQFRGRERALGACARCPARRQ